MIDWDVPSGGVSGATVALDATQALALFIAATSFARNAAFLRQASGMPSDFQQLSKTEQRFVKKIIDVLLDRNGSPR